MSIADATGIDPAAALILETVRTRPSMDEVGVEASRAAAGSRTTNPPYEDVHTVVDAAVDTEAGSIAVRVYRPSEDRGLPAIVYYHAGGWILGDLEHSDHLCRRFANRTGAVVVNVDYRLSPEVRYPAANDDAAAVLQWVADNADNADGLGIDPNRIALAGESSGGSLAAATAVRSVSAGGPAVAGLLLLCPAVDPAMGSESWSELGADFLPPRRQMAWMWDMYLGDLPRTEYTRWVRPGDHGDLEAHPPTIVVSAELDPLRDEAERYGTHLRSHGVAVEIRREPGLIHAFCNLGGVIPEGLAAFDRAADDLAALLAR